MLPWLLAAYLAGQTADVTSTVIKLHPPFYETSPFLPNTRTGIVLTKGALAAGETALVRHWRKTHPRWAAVICIAGATSGTIAFVHNMRLHPH